MAEKAIIEVLEGPYKDKLKVMFNPQKYTVTKELEVSGEGANRQFKVVTMPTFTVDLFFDTYEKEGTDIERNVRLETNKFVNLLMPSVGGRERKRPPRCLFIWGDFSYAGTISQVDQNFTMFLESGIPVRATLTVTFVSDITPEEDRELRGSEACRKLWTVKSGDRLDRIAYSALKDAAQWRKIAKANMITNPLSFPTEEDLGRRLIIPD